MPLTPVMHDRYRARVDHRLRPRDLSHGVRERPRARPQPRAHPPRPERLQDASLGIPEWKARLNVIFLVTTRCLEIAPNESSCLMWHAASHGVLARGSWNPLNIRLPPQLMDEFHRARGGRCPGTRSRRLRDAREASHAAQECRATSAAIRRPGGS